MLPLTSGPIVAVRWHDVFVANGLWVNTDGSTVVPLGSWSVGHGDKALWRNLWSIMLRQRIVASYHLTGSVAEGDQPLRVLGH